MLAPLAVAFAEKIQVIRFDNSHYRMLEFKKEFSKELLVYQVVKKRLQRCSCYIINIKLTLG
jgi:hypothetical protein